MRSTTRHSEAGQALIMALVVSLIMVIVGIAVLTSALSSLDTVYGAYTSARVHAVVTSVVDGVYVPLERAPVSQAETEAANASSSAWEPANASSGAEAQVQCSSATPYCYFLLVGTPKNYTVEQNGIPVQAAAIPITVYTEHGCSSQGGGPLPAQSGFPDPACQYSEYVTTMYSANYLDFMEFTNTQKLNSQQQTEYCANGGTTCLHAYYTTGDSVDGPVHTNGTYLYYCGSPSFPSDEILQDVSGSWETSPPSGCGSAPSITPSATPTIPFPQSTQISTLQQAAVPPYESSDAPVQVLLGEYQTSSGGLAACSSSSGVPLLSIDGQSCIPYPPNGVIFATGSLTVQGQAQAPITLVAEGDIDVTGNLTVPSGDQATDLVGLIAGGSIELGPSSPEPMTIDAAMLAAGDSSCTGSHCGQIWNLYGATSCSGTCPTITVDGAAVSEWPMILGQYSPSSGAVTSGASLSISYNSALQTAEPPYFVQPTGTYWTLTPLRRVPV